MIPDFDPMNVTYSYIRYKHHKFYIKIFSTQKHQSRFNLPLFLCILLAVFSTTANAGETPPATDSAMLNFSIGQVGIADDLKAPQHYGIEYRMRSFSQWKIIPSIGYAHTENGASYLYTDLRHDFWLTDHWIVTPSFGLGLFNDSEELELGHKLEFSSGIELAYRFQRNYRVGLALFHLSNGGIGDKNPGTETLVVTLSIPL